MDYARLVKLNVLDQGKMSTWWFNKGKYHDLIQILFYLGKISLFTNKIHEDVVFYKNVCNCQKYIGFVCRTLSVCFFSLFCDFSWFIAIGGKILEQVGCKWNVYWFFFYLAVLSLIACWFFLVFDERGTWIVFGSFVVF